MSCAVRLPNALFESRKSPSMGAPLPAVVRTQVSHTAAPSKRTCIVCDSDTRRVFKKHEFWIVACTSCGHRSTALEPSLDHLTAVYGDHYFEGGGAGYTNYVEEGQLLRERGQKYGELLKRHATPG